MNQKELDENHQNWLRQAYEGFEKIKANLYYTNTANAKIAYYAGLVKMNNDIDDAIVSIVKSYMPYRVEYEVNAKKIADALYKRTPKSPELIADGYSDGELVYDMWECPSCGTLYEIECDRYDYCPKCGQAIKWEEEKRKNLTSS